MVFEDYLPYTRLRQTIANFTERPCYEDVESLFSVLGEPQNDFSLLWPAPATPK
jgi:hypothetical protein